MTNQEIFNELGEMGTLMLLFLEMVGADGKVENAEIEAVFAAAENFTDNDVAPHITAASQWYAKLPLDERVAYLGAGLSYFASNLEAGTKKAVLVELAKIAKSDGNIDGAEGALFKMAASYLNA
jgi:uncharacterized tellurite resistance protein B-like protein